MRYLHGSDRIIIIIIFIIDVRELQVDSRVGGG
jgi:hypothetical protein